MEMLIEARSDTAVRNLYKHTLCFLDVIYHQSAYDASMACFDEACLRGESSAAMQHQSLDYLSVSYS